MSVQFLQLCILVKHTHPELDDRVIAYRAVSWETQARNVINKHYNTNNVSFEEYCENLYITTRFTFENLYLLIFIHSMKQIFEIEISKSYLYKNRFSP